MQNKVNVDVTYGSLAGRGEAATLTLTLAIALFEGAPAACGSARDFFLGSLDGFFDWLDVRHAW